MEEHQLSRRERQIMDILHAKGELSAADINAALPDPPSYSTVRTLLRILVEKGALTLREDGPRYLYRPTESRENASQSALKRLVKTFFNGSLADAVAALVDTREGAMSEEELRRIETIIRKAKPKKRN
jgi:predicted transcriptional regulator